MAQRRIFSKRTAQIEAQLADKGAEPATAKERMQADEAASVATRRHKNPDWTPAVLGGRWASEATSVGLPLGKDLIETLRSAAGVGRQSAPSREALFSILVDSEKGVCSHSSRFGEAQVIEAVAAAGAGYWSSTTVQSLARQFLQSRHVIRLIDHDPSGRTPSQWSTVSHRRVEDRVLDNLDDLSARTVAGARGSAVEEAIAAAQHLGDDQAGAVRTLCGPGRALRTLIAPAGHGKTTTLATAAGAFRASGLPVLAMSSTNQAVGELRLAGLEAMTVARFAREPLLAPGTLVICDEFSQLPTGGADIVLGAVSSCPGAQIIFVGDPQQAQPVGAGGLAAYLTADKGHPPMVTAQLSVNRRQADPVEREALVAYRAGNIETSQSLRAGCGWEHSPDGGEKARHDMARAVTADLARHGTVNAVALAVTHADCEDIADRIRAPPSSNRAVSAGPPSKALAGPAPAATKAAIASSSMLRSASLTAADYRTGPPRLLRAYGPKD